MHIQHQLKAMHSPINRSSSALALPLRMCREQQHWKTATLASVAHLERPQQCSEQARLSRAIAHSSSIVLIPASHCHHTPVSQRIADRVSEGPKTLHNDLLQH
jgi:hypothetical protein